MTQFLITAAAWTAITSAGETVSCWLDEDGDGASGHVDVRLTHSIEGVPTDNPTACKRIRAETTVLSADNARDVWYARCMNAEDKATISTDKGVNLIHEVDVNVQSQDNPIVQLYLMSEDKTDIHLSAGIAAGVSVIPVTAGHGFTTPVDEPNADWILIWENGLFFQAHVIYVSGDNVTVGMPTDATFTTNASIIRGKINLAVNGATTPKHFYLRPLLSTIPIDFSTVMVLMAHTTEADDGKFGGITALTNGLLIKRDGGFTQGLGNYRTNQKFRDFGFEVTYPAKAPSGTYATEARMRMIETFTQELRMDPRLNDFIQATVRDNLSGLTRLAISFLGSYTSGE